uniref:Uncharacterized protein n=1 Tax=Arundo donax TaxID=35708 RepID=A0A0A9GZY3_ARUDO
MIGGAGRSRRRGRAPTALPTSPAARRTEPSVSCWYCDCKIYAFNDILFNLGWKYGGCVRAWFSIGVCFSLIALVGISLMLLWHSIGAFYFRNGSLIAWLQNLLVSRIWYFIFQLVTSTTHCAFLLVTDFRAQHIYNGHHNHHNINNLFYCSS